MTEDHSDEALDAPTIIRRRPAGPLTVRAGVSPDADRFTWNTTTGSWDAQVGHVWTGSAWLPAVV